MAVKDVVVSWFIKNIFIPKINVWDNPGFIITRFTDKGKEIYIREAFVPEDILINLEKEIYKKYKKRGRQALYSAGKKFGYAYASSSKFTKINEESKRNFINFVDFTINYIACTWARKMEHELDLSNKKLTFQLYDIIVCSKNGLGYIMTEGGTAGLWSFMVDDKSVEATQLKCQGNGYKNCSLITAPYKYFKGKKIDVLREENVFPFKPDNKYLIFNRIKKSEYSSNSLKSLLDSNIFSYKEGRLEFNKKRLFDFGCSFIYILEEELSKIERSNKTLFNVSFNFGKKITKNIKEKDFLKFVCDFLSALGWGDNLILKKKGKYILISKMHPWVNNSTDKSNFIIFKGIASGLLSGFLKKNVLFKKHQINTDNNSLDLVIRS